MNCPFLIEWELIGKDKDGNVIHHTPPKPNLQVNGGKVQNLNWIGHIATSAPSGFIFLMIGPCANTPSVTDTTLGGGSGYEYIGNSQRIVISNFTVSAETTVYSGITFTQKMVGSVTIDGATDLNATVPGSPLQTYGLNSSPTLPGTPTGSSGIMFNELVDSTQFLLKSAPNTTSITVNIVLRQ